jgi:hypothetical protein
VTACGCCTGTIGACTEGCCCAACNPAPGGRTRDAREEIARACPLCPHPRSEHWRGDHSCQHRDGDRFCPCIGTAPTPWKL